MEYWIWWRSDTIHHHPQGQLCARRSNLLALDTIVVSTSHWQPPKTWWDMVQHQFQALHHILEPRKVRVYHTLGDRQQRRMHILRAKDQQISHYHGRNWRVPEQWRQVICVIWLLTIFGHQRRRQWIIIEALSHLENRQGSVHQQLGPEVHFKTNITQGQPTNCHLKAGEHNLCTTKNLPPISAVFTEEKEQRYAEKPQ